MIVRKGDIVMLEVAVQMLVVGLSWLGRWPI